MKSFLDFSIILVVAAASFLTGMAYGLSPNAVPDRKDLPPMDMTQAPVLKYSPIVKLFDKDSGDFFCSGTVVASNYIVTAGHCLRGRDKYKKTIEVRSASGAKTGALGVAVFYEDISDQGLVLGDFSEFNVLGFTSDPQLINEALLDQDRFVIACGFPYGGDLYCSPILQRRQYGFGVQGFGQLYPGCSGGPVIDILSGLIVAVNTSVTEPGIFVSPLVELPVHAKLPDLDKK